LPFILFLFAAVSFGANQSSCPRPVPGALVRPAAELRSANGVLRADFALRTNLDVYGLTNYCFVDADGAQNPMLRVNPGDEIVLNLKNELPPAAGPPGHLHSDSCGHGPVTASSTNLHFHGLSLPPVCHQDDVIHTLVQPGDTAFEYRMKIPANATPGLYWYHPHPHGFTEKQVIGGASGPLIVEGIERAVPEVAGLPERVLVLRDQLIGGLREDEAGEGATRPSLDLSVNFVPVLFPLYKPGVLPVRPGQKEFWRVLNAAADTFFDLQLMYWTNPDTPVSQTMRVIAVDGSPVGPAFARERQSLLLPPGARVEFIMETPAAGMQAQFLTRRYNNGPLGDSDTYRVLANLRSVNDAPLLPSLPRAAAAPAPFNGLTLLHAAQERHLYFSEASPDAAHPKNNVSYFITIEGAEPKVFDMNFKTPDIVAKSGTVEDWVIENRATESHVFHIHQLHFQVLERDGRAVNESALRDTIDLPFWDGKSTTYPAVKLRMDFRDPNIVGTFLYHCHILEHEDAGMMGSIEIRRVTN
jgi:FtsP/CotA-like multicopper oxidase with cupredoxin domain